MAESQNKVFAAFWYSIIGRLLCTNSRKEDQKEEKNGVQIFDLHHFDLHSLNPHQPMSASLAFTTDAMRLLEEEKEKDLLKPKQPMTAFFMFRNEQRAESKSGWEIAKQNMEKYLEEVEAYKQRKEEESANPKKEENEMMKIHKQDKKEEKTDNTIKKTKENRQKKKKIADPNKPNKPASSFLLFMMLELLVVTDEPYGEARKNLLEERLGINDSTLNALISVKWKELSEEDKQTWNEKAVGAKEPRWNWKSITNLQQWRRKTTTTHNKMKKRARYSCSLSAFYAYGLQQTHIKICATGGCGGIYSEPTSKLLQCNKKTLCFVSFNGKFIFEYPLGLFNLSLPLIPRWLHAMSAVRKSSDANEESGMRSLTMEDWKHARSVVGPSITRGVTLEIHKVSWEDIGGLKNLKKKLQQAVEWPLKHSAAFSRLGVSPVCGILLHGPPGCSKTAIAKAVAHAAQVSFFSLRQLYSMYVGEGEALLHNTFRRARLAAPSIIFFDEADVVAAKRGGKSSSNIAVGEWLLSTLLTEMDGLEQAKGILVLAATNRPHAIDVALMRPGRFDLILSVHTRNMKVSNDVDLKQIAEDTELFTGAELEGLCREAGIVTLREDISASVVCNRHFQTVWRSLKPVLTREEVNSYSSFMKNPSLISSGSSKASAKQNSKHTTSLLGSVGPTDRFPNELATT
ncbi:unnamed protein product [Camellia sinensis]